MALVGITFLLLAIAVGCYFYGVWKLAQYGFRISSGTGLAVLLFPPFAFYFSFYKLEQEGKEMPTTLFTFGILTTALLLVVFWTPISLVLTGNVDQLDTPVGVADAAVAAHGNAEASAPAEEPADEPEQAAEEQAPAEEPAANAGTNNAAPQGQTAGATQGATNGAGAAEGQ